MPGMLQTITIPADFKVYFGKARPLQIDTAKASIDNPTASIKSSNNPIIFPPLKLKRPIDNKAFF